MKELDKAIINGDIKHLALLILEGVDIKGAVLIHLKELLVPEHFSLEELQTRGAILTMDELKQKVSIYIDKSQYEYRHEVYIKRIYLGVQQMLKSWQEGKMRNKEVEDQFDLDATTHLARLWVKVSLPKGLQAYAERKEKEYIERKYTLWQSQSLDSKDSMEIDACLQETLLKHWYHADDQDDKVVEQIKRNLQMQIVEYFKYPETNNQYISEMKQFIYKRLEDQIYDGSINEEIIKDAVEQEMRRELKGQIVSDNMPFYKKAIKSLLQKWATGQLDIVASEEISRYVASQFSEYKLPEGLKIELVKKSIQQLLKQYKDHQLEPELEKNLALQFEGNITAFFEQRAQKETNFRDELSQYIFSTLLVDWKAQALPEEEKVYLQTTTLSDVHDLIQKLGLYTSRSAIFKKVSQLEGLITSLQTEVAELRQGQHAREGAPEVPQEPVKAQGFFR